MCDPCVLCSPRMVSARPGTDRYERADWARSYHYDATGGPGSVDPSRIPLQQSVAVRDRSGPHLIAQRSVECLIEIAQRSVDCLIEHIVGFRALVLRLGIRVVRVRDLEQSAAPDPVSRSSRRSLRPAQPPLPYGQVMISRKVPARVRPVHASTTIAWCRSRQANAVQGRPSTTGRGLGSGQVFRRSRPR